MKHWKVAVVVLLCVVAGFIGQSAWYHVTNVVKDIAFAHEIRLMNEDQMRLRQAQQIQQAQHPQGK